MHCCQISINIAIGGLDRAYAYWLQTESSIHSIFILSAFESLLIRIYQPLDLKTVRIMQDSHLQPRAKKSYQCYCGRSYTFAQGISRHLKKSKSRTVQCILCLGTYLVKEEAEDHLLRGSKCAIKLLESNGSVKGNIVRLTRFAI